MTTVYPSTVYVVVAKVKGMKSVYTYVFTNRRSALLYVATKQKENEIVNDLGDIDEGDDNALSNIESRIDWDGKYDLQTQVLDSTENPEVGW